MGVFHLFADLRVELLIRIFCYKRMLVDPRGSTQYNDPPGDVPANRVSFSVESSGTGLYPLHLYSRIGLYFLHVYSGTDQIVIKNSNILPKSSCSSQRLLNKDSEQKMYLIECLALDHG